MQHATCNMPTATCNMPKTSLTPKLPKPSADRTAVVYLKLVLKSGPTLFAFKVPWRRRHAFEVFAWEKVGQMLLLLLVCFVVVSAAAVVVVVVVVFGVVVVVVRRKYAAPHFCWNLLEVGGRLLGLNLSEQRATQANGRHRVDAKADGQSKQSEFEH